VRRERREYPDAGHYTAAALRETPLGETVAVTLLDGQRALYRRVQAHRPGRDEWTPIQNARISSESLALLAEMTHVVASLD
jgi:hypothetical protein